MSPFEDRWPDTDQLRADAALGAAWRRCEAAAGQDDLRLSSWWDGEFRWYAANCASVSNAEGDDTATAALTALAELLESR